MTEMVPGRFALFTLFALGRFAPGRLAALGAKATQILKTINQSTNDYRKPVYANYMGPPVMTDGNSAWTGVSLPIVGPNDRYEQARSCNRNIAIIV